MGALNVHLPDGASAKLTAPDVAIKNRGRFGLALRNLGWFWPLRYLASLSPARQVLWCYLIWYGFVFEDYFDPNPPLWLSSLAISAFMGTALYVSTAFAGSSRLKLEPWQVARFYLMPLCVSSYAALIKDQGFVLIFHPTVADNLRPAAACAAFVALSAAARRLR
jgi:hypothetical protein